MARAREIAEHSVIYQHSAGETQDASGRAGEQRLWVLALPESLSFTRAGSVSSIICMPESTLKINLPVQYSPGRQRACALQETQSSINTAMMENIFEGKHLHQGQSSCIAESQKQERRVLPLSGRSHTLCHGSE